MSVTDSHRSNASPGYAASVGPRHLANGGIGHRLDHSSPNERPDALWPDARQHELWAAELQARRIRAKVASRLELVNLNHAEHAWRLRNSFGIAPTCLALVYLEPGPEFEVRIAGKVFPDTEQVTDAGKLLYDVCALAREVIAAGQDPRLEMSENPEPMSPLATFHGVALSTLDTPAGTWKEVKARTSGGCLHIPGRVLSLLADDTMMLADRLERHHPVHYFVSATGWLDAAWVGLGRTWRHAPELASLGDPSTRDLWLRLVELRGIVTGAGHVH
jgi:hypothetical protein